MTDYKNKLGGLANRLREEQPKTPIQEVKPIKSQSAQKPPEGQLNVWIPKPLMKKVKNYSVEHELTQKDITILALENLLRGT